MMDLADRRIQKMLENDRLDALARIRSQKPHTVYFSNVNPPQMEAYFMAESDEWHRCPNNLELYLSGLPK